MAKEFAVFDSDSHVVRAGDTVGEISRTGIPHAREAHMWRQEGRTGFYLTSIDDRPIHPRPRVDGPRRMPAGIEEMHGMLGLCQDPGLPIPSSSHAWRSD